MIAKDRPDEALVDDLSGPPRSALAVLALDKYGVTRLGWGDPGGVPMVFVKPLRVAGSRRGCRRGASRR